MTSPQRPCGLSQSLAFLIPDHWTPEQALAVVELLDDLRSRIWDHYQLPLLELIHDDYHPIGQTDRSSTEDNSF